MAVVGAYTRLTESGLSITEWKPLTGAIPPLNTEEWQQEFEKYKQIPEYKEKNSGMNLNEFKQIYLVEYTHRLIGRITGIIFLLPLLYFLFTKKIKHPISTKLFFIFALGGVQGFIGWYMVKSGLSGRVDVSQYRLALHLGLAVIIFWMLFKMALGMRSQGSGVSNKPSTTSHQLSTIIPLLIFFQIILGAFVAGLDAGKTYNTFPLMDGEIIPAGLFTLSPIYLNFFENITMVQFNHRLGAYILTIAIFFFWIKARNDKLTNNVRAACNLLLVALVIQFILGVSTLLQGVPVVLATVHQFMAFILLAISLFINHSLCDRRKRN